MTSQALTAQLAGVVTLKVGAGQRVRRGQVLASIETMKLEASIFAPTDGIVVRVHARDFETVAAGDPICELQEPA